jgi:agmatine deiminase
MEVVVTVELSLLKFVIIVTFIILTYIVRTPRTWRKCGSSIMEAGQKIAPRSTMANRKWKMPAEWHPHKCCWMLVPYRKDNWRRGAVPGQRAFLNVAVAIAAFEKVMLGVHPSIKRSFSAVFNEVTRDMPAGFGIELFDVEYDDCWMRDVGATVLHNNTTSQPSTSVPSSKDPSIAQVEQQLLSCQSKLIGMDWIFNAWGEKYSYWGNDDKVAAAMIELSNQHNSATSDEIIQRIRADFVLEGGSIHVDGEGTVLVTEECLLHPNRNPNLSKTQIEERLRVYLGVDVVIWLPRGLTADHDTNGHIDNIACFARPGVVLLSWTEDAADPMYEICREAEAVLTSTLDAQSRTLEVLRLPLPVPMHYTEEECQDREYIELSVDVSDSPHTAHHTDTDGSESARGTDVPVGAAGYDFREVGARMAGSYVNFYIANGGIVVPSFDQPLYDAAAVEVLKQAFPQHTVVSVPGCREILLGGGNIHCITQQQPLPL